MARTHIFKENSAFECGAGKCIMHPGGPDCRVPLRPDLSTHGLPCQSVTQWRQRTGTTPRTSAIPEHPDHATVFDGFDQYLVARRPGGFTVEEVTVLEHIDRTTGRPFLKQFCTMCARRGYAMRVLRLDHGVWVELSRLRLFIAGFDDATGHAKAVDLFVERVLEAKQYRAIGAPTCVWSVVEPFEVLE